MKSAETGKLKDVMNVNMKVNSSKFETGCKDKSIPE